MRLLRFFDWRFLIAATMLVLIGTVCCTTVVELDAKSDRINTLIANQAAEDERSAKQRDELIAGQRDLQTKYDDLAEQNRRMADLLESYGVDVPATFRAGPTTIVERDNDDGGETIIVRPDDTRRPSATPPSSSPRPTPTPPGLKLPDVTDTINDLLNSVPVQ